MKLSAQKHTQGTRVDEQIMINIVGSLQLQNELFSEVIAKATNFPCLCSHGVSLNDLVEIKKGKNGLILWDCVDVDKDTLWSKIDPDLNFDDVFLVLFNVSPNQKIEGQALKRGVRGIFYRGDSLASYKKGIMAVLDGELWYTREVLAKSLVEARSNIKTTDEKQTVLTFREKEILAMIAAGLSKDDIADGLGISPHTVKTHTHNIYQKINVPNRIKAAMWATRNLHYPNGGYRGVQNANIV